MVSYDCKVCNFTTKLKTDYVRHLKTKKHGHNINPNYSIETEIVLKSQKEPVKSQKEPVKSQKEPVKSQENEKIKKYKCDYCDNLFVTFSNKRRHELHRCKFIPLIDNTIEGLKKDKKKLEKDKEKLEKKVDKLTDRIGNTTNIQTNNNNIKINSYGDEDVSHITEAFKTSLLSSPYGAIPKMIEAIHFNDNVPENKNVLMPNVNKKILRIKKGDNWFHENKEMIIHDMIDSKYLMLDDHFNLIVNGETLSQFTKDIFHKFRNKYDDGNKDLMSDIKGGCNLLIMNSRKN